MFDGEAVCRSELGAHQMQEGWQEISEITWMGDICLGTALLDVFWTSTPIFKLH